MPTVPWVSRRPAPPRRAPRPPASSAALGATDAEPIRLNARTGGLVRARLAALALLDGGRS